MDLDEDIIAAIALLCFALACLLAIILFFIGWKYGKEQNIELEKYKIEMQVKHGDIVIEEGE